MRRSRLRALGLALALVLLPAAQAAQLKEDRGFAVDLDSGRPLYEEQHLLRRNGAGRLEERLVLYRCTDGTPFARKQVDYRGSASAPAFQFEDARSGYREGLRREGDVASVFVVRPQAEKREAPLPPGELVADAGFDQWVRAAWPRLAGGESVPMRFLVPSRLDSFGFRVAEVPGDTAADGAARRFRLRLGGLLGWFAPHIDVVYAEADRRLLRFEGLSNLRDDAGVRPLKVRIEFPQAPRPAEPGAWERLAAEPLKPCRVQG
ncbi:MAG: hypothetical protein ACK4JC_10980 [Silanimonas lenta]